VINRNIGYIGILSVIEKNFGQNLGKNLSFCTEMNIYSLLTISHKDICLIMLKNIRT
jgi:hypothetical protein